MSFEENQNNNIFVVNGVANYSFVKESITKIGIFSVLFSVLYPVAWFYQQWKEIKKNNESYKNISPFWRSIFYPIYVFPFTEIIEDLITAKEDIALKSTALAEDQISLKKEYKRLKRLSPVPYMILISSFIFFVLIGISDPQINTALGPTILIFISCSLASLQKAINKFLPLNHPKNKVITWADFLCVPLFIIIIAYAIFINNLQIKHCFKTENNVLENICENYSFTFPLNLPIQRFKNNFCQSTDTEGFCLSKVYLNNSSQFNLEKLIQREKLKPINKFTKYYVWNTTHCFTIKEHEEKFYNICYMELRGQFSYLRIASYNKNGSIGNIEKLMNSYKNL